MVACFLTLCLLLCENFFLPLPPASAAVKVETPFSIPPKLAAVEEFHKGALPKNILFVQDAHDSLEAQEHIAALIGHLVENHGVQTVLEEGYEGPVPTDALFEKITEPAVKQRVAYFLLDKLRIGAAEYAHINRVKPGVFCKG